MLNFNKKFIGLSVLVLFAVSVFCYTITKAEQTSSLNCQKEKGYTEIVENDVHKCYNPKTKISYDKERLKFYRDGVICGETCDLDGRNCKEGFCNVLDCASENGYTEVKILTDRYGNNHFGFCYNPKTGLAYQKCTNEEVLKKYYYRYKNELYTFYYKDYDIYYGTCDINSENCLPRYPSHANAKVTFFDLIKNGYTEIIKVEAPESYYYGKEIETAVYNPKTMLSSDYHSNFYYQGAWCGENCDSNGRNCEKGVCNVKDCPIGHTKFKIVDKKNRFCPINKSVCILYKNNYAIIKHAVCSIL